MAALGIGFGNVLLTDPFDVLFALIFSDAQASQIRSRLRSSDRFESLIDCKKIEDYAVFSCILLYCTSLYFEKI